MKTGSMQVVTADATNTSTNSTANDVIDPHRTILTRLPVCYFAAAVITPWAPGDIY